MEEQLTRIADAFERIAASLHWIQQEGLELYSKSGCLRLHIDDMPLPDGPLPMDFPVHLLIELKNESYGTKTIPFEISQQ
jgi:hypothetical protein